MVTYLAGNGWVYVAYPYRHFQIKTITLTEYATYTLLVNRKIMWIRTVNGIEWIEVEQTAQGLWIPKR